MIIRKQLKEHLAKISEQEKNLNLMKLMFIYFEDKKMMPEMLTFSYYEADNIKSRFVVMNNLIDDLLVEFTNLKSAIRFTELLSGNLRFCTHEFYDAFRIIEISEDDKDDENNVKILSIIVNLVDYFDVICAIQDGKYNKNLFINDNDFNEYYKHFINIL